MSKEKLIVTQDDGGYFHCSAEAASGAAIEGRGKSVAEAVGLWAIYSQTVEIRCSPPSLLHEFSISNRYEDLNFSGCVHR